MNTPTQPEDHSDTAVVLATYDVGRLPLLERAIDSAVGQGPGVEVVVAVDNNPNLRDLVSQRRPGVRVVFNSGPRGASATRNVGARAASRTYLALLDDDAVAEPGWLAAVVQPLRDDPSVVGVGGWVEAEWPAGRPVWFPPEFDFVVGASYRGLPTRPGPVRNGWAENMAVRAADFHAVGGFREDFGKVGNWSRPEDTELGLRMTEKLAGQWWWQPSARVRHHVPPERATLAFFWRRNRLEGAGKAELAALAGRKTGLSTERSYITRTLPTGVLMGLLDALRGRPGGPLRSLAIIVGLLAAGVGFVDASVRRRFASAAS